MHQYNINIIMSIEELNTLDKESYIFPYKSFVIYLIAIKFLFKNYLNLRQYNKLNSRKEIPKELSDLNIKEEKYLKSNNYSKDKIKFQVIKESIEVAIEILLIYFNYYALIWSTSHKILDHFEYNSQNEYFNIFLFILLESIRSTIYDIPFSLYESFVLEEKYGFNKKTYFLFIKDEILGFILKLIFTPLIISGINYVISIGGKYFYIYAEIFALVLILLLMWIYPNIIAPLFNKFSELEDGKLKTSLYNLAEKVKFPLKKIYLVDASRRTAHSNAYLYGFGSNKRIVLFDTLINKLENNEIEAVLCHELGHWKYNHTLKSLINVLLQTFMMFYIFGFYMNNENIFVGFGFQEKSTFIGLSLFFLIYAPISYILEIFSLKLSRTFEYEADQFANEMGMGNELKSGLKKLFEENMSDMDPDTLYSQFNHSHPTLLERFKAIEKLNMKMK